MADEEHVALLKQGVDAWNAWRDENPDVSPDLSRTDLARANLRKANLVRAKLYGSDLARANLSRGAQAGQRMRAVIPSFDRI